MFELANTQGFRGTECAVEQSFEDIQKDGIRGCGSAGSYVFFVSFVVLVSMLVMNLSLAAVIEGLDTAKKENHGIVSGDDIDALIEMWSEYDPDATGYISMQDLVFLLYELPPPLGKRSSKAHAARRDADINLQGATTPANQDKFLINIEKGIVLKKIDALDLLKDLKIVLYQDHKIFYTDVIQSLLVRRLRDKDVDYHLNQNLSNRLTSKWRQKHKNPLGKKNQGHFQDQGVTREYTVLEEQAAGIINKWAKRRVQEMNEKLLASGFDRSAWRNLESKKRRHARTEAPDRILQREEARDRHV